MEPNGWCAILRYMILRKKLCQKKEILLRLRNNMTCLYLKERVGGLMLNIEAVISAKVR